MQILVCKKKRRGKIMFWFRNLINLGRAQLWFGHKTEEKKDSGFYIQGCVSSYCSLLLSMLVGVVGAEVQNIWGASGYLHWAMRLISRAFGGARSVKTSPWHFVAWGKYYKWCEMRMLDKKLDWSSMLVMKQSSAKNRGQRPGCESYNSLTFGLLAFSPSA